MKRLSRRNLRGGDWRTASRWAVYQRMLVRLGNGPIRPAVLVSQILVLPAPQIRFLGNTKKSRFSILKGDYRYSDEEKLISSMREKAGEMGANALILDAMSEPTAGAKVAQVFFGGAARKGSAVAIWVFPTIPSSKP